MPMIETEIFRALADPTRRAVFERVMTREMSVTELKGHFAVSQPAISQCSSCIPFARSGCGAPAGSGGTCARTGRLVRMGAGLAPDQPARAPAVRPRASSHRAARRRHARATGGDEKPGEKRLRRNAIIKLRLPDSINETSSF